MEIKKKKDVITCQIFIVLLSTPPPPAAAQVAGTGTIPVSSGQEVNKTMAIVFVALITAFFIFGIFSFYKRRWRERRFRRAFAIGSGGAGGGVRWRPARGLDPSFIATFPTLVYSAVKGLKIGKISLECAICLSEFENSDKLRLIPNCSHVFHSVCVDAWLVSNSTCPVCRADLCPDSGQVTLSILNFDSNPPPPSPPQSHVAIPVVDGHRAGENQSNLMQFNSTGQERYTLRLPEAVRNRLMNSTVNRTRSLAELPRERSLRRGYRSETVETGGWRNFLRRTLSVPAPAVGRTALTGWSPVEDDAGERSFARLRASGNGQSSAAN